MPTFVRHLFLWLVVYVVYTYMMSFYDDFYERAIGNLVNVPLFMLAYYLLREVQIPCFYNEGKNLTFGLSLLASTLLIAVTCRLNGIWWMDSFFGHDSSAIPFMTPGSYLLKTVRYYTPAMAILAWESHQIHRSELERIQALEKEKIAAELKYLRAQLNPHFLFNTLNNLYSFVITQSPKAPDMIMRLSGMLDYVLYRSRQASVSLREEVTTIEHFLELEKVRYGDRLSVTFQTHGDLGTPVGPLLILSLVENAFKHGASGNLEDPRIKIEIGASREAIRCTVWNTKSTATGELNDGYKSGIGLSNIRRQLKLIYPEAHELCIKETAESFEVSLLLNHLP